MHIIILFIFLLIGVVIGFINATSGGGGVISTPLFLAFGLSPYVALATSKLVPIGGLITGTVKYNRAKLIEKNKSVLLLSIIVAVGAIVAANLTIQINAAVLKYIILISSIVILLLITFKKSEGIKTNHDEKEHIRIRDPRIIFWVFLVSIYQGSIGIGGGVFLAFIFRHFMKYSYLKGAALMNTLSIIITVASASTFAFKGIMNFEYGIPMFIGNTIGGYIGAHVAIKKGDTLLKIITIIVSIAIIIKVFFT